MQSFYQIEIVNLLWIFGLVLIVFYIHLRWAMNAFTVAYGVVRMLLQLIMIGYLLAFMFNSSNPWLISSVLGVMLFFASYIALRPMKNKSKHLYLNVFISIFVGGVLTLIVVTQGVIGLTPWYEPHYLIPLAGMIFANSMNVVSIAAERFEVENGRGVNYKEARSAAYNAALIPVLNSLFAVGLVSLPGMMTGQILSGISPLIAVRYQIMVMLMILSSAGISSAIYLTLLDRNSK